MAKKGDQPRSAIVDNWLLQLACEILEFGLLEEGQEFRVHRISGYDTMVWSAFEVREGEKPNWGWFTLDHVSALLQLLDVLVLYDKVAHDVVRSYVWEESAAFGPLSGLLNPVQVPKELPDAFTEFLQENRAQGSRKSGILSVTASGPASTFDESRDVGLIEDPFWERPSSVGSSEAALFYLAFALRRNLTYWPSPRRADYLRNHMKHLEVVPDVGIRFQQNLRDATRSMAQRLVDANSNFLTMPALLLPGFGATVLNQCETPNRILATVMEMRRSRPAIAFRDWLAEYQTAVMGGNLLRAAEYVKEVGDILAELERDLGLDGEIESQLELEIGVTPSVTVGGRTIDRFFRKVLPKPRHLIFIRDYVERALSATHVLRTVKRLFPDLPLYRGAP